MSKILIRRILDPEDHAATHFQELRVEMDVWDGDGDEEYEVFGGDVLEEVLEKIGNLKVFR